MAEGECCMMHGVLVVRTACVDGSQFSEGRTRGQVVRAVWVVTETGGARYPCGEMMGVGRPPHRPHIFSCPLARQRDSRDTSGHVRCVVVSIEGSRRREEPVWIMPEDWLNGLSPEYQGPDESEDSASEKSIDAAIDDRVAEDLSKAQVK